MMISLRNCAIPKIKEVGVLRKGVAELKDLIISAVCSVALCSSISSISIHSTLFSLAVSVFRSACLSFSLYSSL